MKMYKRLSERILFHWQICIASKRKYSDSAAVFPMSLDSNEPGVEESIEAKRERLENLRNRYPEFLPNPMLSKRHPLTELLEREDMLRRRKNLDIPQFFVGSILAVTTSDQNSPDKSVRFLGICIQRYHHGLRSKFVLRNVVQNEGIEIRYSLYSPLIEKIEVIKLEKRLDEELFYLRDAPLEYSTFPFDMERQYFDEAAGIPINTLQVPLNPRPWYARWERMNLQGAIIPPLSEKLIRQAKEHEKPWEKYDLMDQYRKTISEEEMEEVSAHISNTLEKLQMRQKIGKQKKVLEKIPKQKLF